MVPRRPFPQGPQSITVIVGALGAVAVAACGHNPPAPTTTTPPPRSELIPATFPPGSTRAPDNDKPLPSPLPSGILTPPPLKPGQKSEGWSIPVPVRDEAKDLRRQLPVYGPLGDMGWCVDDSYRETIEWAWGNDKQVLQVIAQGPPPGEPGSTSSSVIINRFMISCSEYINNAGP
jgi:hypothetical protein